MQEKRSGHLQWMWRLMQSRESFFGKSHVSTFPLKMRFNHDTCHRTDCCNVDSMLCFTIVVILFSKKVANANRNKCTGLMDTQEPHPCLEFFSKNNACPNHDSHSSTACKCFFCVSTCGWLDANLGPLDSVGRARLISICVDIL